MNDISSCPTYHRILETSIALIKNEGFKALTVRRVAAEAGVNIAAVNYHFKSKENLVDAAIGEMAAPLIHKIHELVISSLSPRKKMKGILSAYAHYVQGVPQFLIRNLTADAYKFNNSRGFIELKRAGLGEIKKVASELFPKMNDTEIFVTIVQIFGAVALPALFIPLHGDGLKKIGISLPDIDEQIEILLNNYLNNKE